MLYRAIVKPLLFQFDAEKAHHLTINGLSTVAKWPVIISLLEQMYGVEDIPELSNDIWGIHFPSPVGLAAGLDKNAVAVGGLSAIGFGFAEVGTVTPEPQSGNAKPRLFRLPNDQALINRMGFNNCGALELASNLQRLPARNIPIAINIGKNKDTPVEQTAEDYRKCIQTLYSMGDFFVVNISSPNTPGLRNLQFGEQLHDLLQMVQEEMERQSQLLALPLKPVLVKIAPDLTDDELKEIIATFVHNNISGVIATNTTLSREGLSDEYANESGGLSGKPLMKRSTELIRNIYRWTEGKLPIIGSGGIFSAADAYEKIRAGASLVEIYTALIYQGPGINRKLHLGLQALLMKDGYAHISQAVGADV